MAETRFMLRRSKRALGRRKRLFLSLLLPLLLILAVAMPSSALLHRQLCLAAENAAENAFNDIIGRTVQKLAEENRSLYRQLVTVSRDADGVVTAIETDTAAAAILSAAFNAALKKTLPDRCEIAFPIGNLSGSDFLNGRGQTVRFRAVLSSAAVVGVDGSFTSVGINQTLHRLFLSVKARIAVLLPGRDLVQEYAFSCPLTETVIVGRVPDVYLGGSEGP
jgi:sporulation protein YunB